MGFQGRHTRLHSVLVLDHFAGFGWVTTTREGASVVPGMCVCAHAYYTSCSLCLPDHHNPIYCCRRCQGPDCRPVRGQKNSLPVHIAGAFFLVKASVWRSQKDVWVGNAAQVLFVLPMYFAFGMLALACDN